ncbi:hypothetical protein TNCV_2153931 [Trichonephila clavipes]|nr:hypothetical protein TNCV_2153931 [Trichonephila clavipes]
MLNSSVMYRHTVHAPGITVWGGIGYYPRTPSTHCRYFKQPALHLRGVEASCPSLNLWALKKSPGRLPTWKNDRKAGGGRTVTGVAAEFGINKVSFRAHGKRFKPQVQLLERLVVAAQDDNCRGWPIYPPAGEKRRTAVSKRHCSATLQQRGDKRRGLSVVERLHKGGLFARRLNAASRVES